ncbi:hypothetical protein FH972_023199 [Carpinus fangiana]|uniref:Uncharacterized protein n=1 Tax=Carpinus fangiana TaxID=176857 RepID=A0A5N6KUZ1_9ROSI|nr:hypothetical protein FH972_023199 [Carpinus fangiana]
MDAPTGPPSHDAPQQSTTLPRGFIFHYTDGPGPKTPEPAETSPAAPEQPPPPPRMRVKRRRPLVTASLQCDIPSSDYPVPSIELSESGELPSGMHINPYAAQDHLLSPSSPSFLGRALSPPKTPLSQITTSFDEAPSTRSSWISTPHRRGSNHHICRPPSAWSELSDSSVSSLGSADTFPAFGDCTSPESDGGDPFTFPEVPRLSGAFNQLASPMHVSKRKSHKRTRTEPEAEWTLDMDEHLWLTYMKYLCDPTVTPFKTLPGSAPPLGVCHRVAREAKRSFRGSRTQLTPIAETRRPGEFASLDTVVRRESSMPLEALADSASTIRPEPVQRPHSTSGVRSRVSGRWNASSHQTRKRLRYLCKRKPTLSPHYQRLMQSRSPSPMESSSSHATIRSSHFTSPESRRTNNAFSTRDLNFTLSTATASTMQPGNPLSQLSNGFVSSHAEPSTPERPPSRCNPHQKSQSLQLGLGLGSKQPASDFRPLASPFQELYWQPPTEAGPSSPNPVTQARSSGPLLEIHQPRPLSGSMKRRAQYQLGEELLSDDPELRRNYLEDLFRDSGVAAGKRRVRSRGFSLGAVSHQQRQPSLSEVFTPPSNVEAMEALPTPSVTVSQPALLQPPTTLGGGTKRLGSPFAPTQTLGMSNTFPRRLGYKGSGMETISTIGRQYIRHHDLTKKQEASGEPHVQVTSHPASYRAATFNQSFVKTYNLAKKDSVVFRRDGTDSKAPTLEHQVEDIFVERYGRSHVKSHLHKGSGWGQDNTLFVFHAGTDDIVTEWVNRVGEEPADRNMTLVDMFFAEYQSNLNRVTNPRCIVTRLQSMLTNSQIYDYGARNFIIVGFPALEESPRLRLCGKEKSMMRFGAELTDMNGRLVFMAHMFAESHLDATVFFFDNYRLGINIRSSPKDFEETKEINRLEGFCYPYAISRDVIDTDNELCGAPLRHFYWRDEQHQTEGYHRAQARLMREEMADIRNALPYEFY